MAEVTVSGKRVGRGVNMKWTIPLGLKCSRDREDMDVLV